MVIFENKEYEIISQNDNVSMLKNGNDIRCVATKDIEIKQEKKTKTKKDLIPPVKNSDSTP